LLGVFNGWRTRRVINCLAQEIQNYVNQEDHREKNRLKGSFIGLFENVVKH
jgi:hypothetical protein